VTEARWNEIGEGRWYFEITANRFLRNMVRAVVGTLIEVGRGRMSVEEFAEVIKSGSRSNAGESMPANALFLEDVKYPSTPRST
jgi:tRNA pseudouridine38-40 synthase